MLGKIWQIWWHKKNWRFYVAKCHYARKRARMCVCEFFAKCLKWPQTYAKKIWHDFEHFYFLRARWRADVRMRARFLTWNWRGRILTLIMINMNRKCLSVMKIWSLSKKVPKKTQNGAWMTSWRLGDLENVTVTSYDNVLWLCQNWKKLTKLILSYPLHKKVRKI